MSVKTNSMHFLKNVFAKKISFMTEISEIVVNVSLASCNTCRISKFTVPILFLFSSTISFILHREQSMQSIWSSLLFDGGSQTLHVRRVRWIRCPAADVCLQKWFGFRMQQQWRLSCCRLCMPGSPLCLQEHFYTKRRWMRAR